MSTKRKPLFTDGLARRNDGHVRYKVAFTIKASDMRLWSPERITRFFDGLAEAIRARRGQR